MYIVYDRDDLPAYVGSLDEVADWLGVTINSLYSTISKIKHGKRKATRKGYKVYRV